MKILLVIFAVFAFSQASFASSNGNGKRMEKMKMKAGEFKEKCMEKIDCSAERGGDKRECMAEVKQCIKDMKAESN